MKNPTAHFHVQGVDVMWRGDQFDAPGRVIVGASAGKAGADDRVLREVTRLLRPGPPVRPRPDCAAYPRDSLLGVYWALVGEYGDALVDYDGPTLPGPRPISVPEGAKV